MITTLHATPYNIDAVGFYFTDIESYEKQASNHLDRFGNFVEEFSIQFIDGDDSELFGACSIDQSNLDVWFDEVEVLDGAEKVCLYYLVGLVGYSLSQALEKLDEPSFYLGDLKDAAIEIFDECYLHAVPESIQSYIDYDRFARDCELGGDMCEFEYAGETYTCTNANGL